MSSTELNQPANSLPRAIGRAKRIEDKLRDVAFLSVREEINGVEVNQLTLRHLTILFYIQSPFLFGGIRKIEDVGTFLWIVSPHYCVHDKPVPLTRRERFFYWLHRKHVPTMREAFLSQLVCHPKWQLFYRAIDRYLDRALMDKPPMTSGGTRMATSFAAGIIDRIAAAYGWRDEAILDTPMSRIYQLMKWIEVRGNPKTPQFNPLRDRITQRYLDKL